MRKFVEKRLERIAESANGDGPIPIEEEKGHDGRVNSPDALSFSDELEQSRREILQLAERVKRLVAKRSEREALVQQFRRSTTISSRNTDIIRKRQFNLCSLCATDHASAKVEHVRASAPGSKCDHCGQPAIMWIELAR